LDVRILLATGLKLLCVPYSWLAKIFRMPSEEEIFHSLWNDSTDNNETEGEVTSPPNPDGDGFGDAAEINDTEDEFAQVQTV
jgi:hypothetical protein